MVLAKQKRNKVALIKEENYLNECIDYVGEYIKTCDSIIEKDKELRNKKTDYRKIYRKFLAGDDTITQKRVDILENQFKKVKEERDGIIKLLNILEDEIRTNGEVKLRKKLKKLTK